MCALAAGGGNQPPALWPIVKVRGPPSVPLSLNSLGRNKEATLWQWASALDGASTLGAATFAACRRGTRGSSNARTGKLLSPFVPTSSRTPIGLYLLLVASPSLTNRCSRTVHHLKWRGHRVLKEQDSPAAHRLGPPISACTGRTGGLCDPFLLFSRPPAALAFPEQHLARSAAQELHPT